MKTYDELKALIEQRGVHPLLGSEGQGWGIEQNPHELATFLTRMQELGVTSCLEIGTGYKGGLAHFLARDMQWWVTSIDIQDYGHRPDEYERVSFWVWPERRHMELTYDLVFIDGAHDYASVKADYEMYGKLATKAIAFHDIAGLRACEGAAEFWHRLLYSEGWKRADAIVDTEHPAGIGWIELE